MEKKSDIILVGNSQSVNSGEYGELINSYETVVRFDLFHIKGRENNVGTKTDIWVTTIYDESRCKNYEYKNVYEHSWERTPEKDKNYNKLKSVFPDIIKMDHSLLDEMKKYIGDNEYNAFSTELIAIWMFLKKHKSIDIIGFDWQKEKVHYHDDEQTVGSLHQPANELKFISKLVGSGKVNDLNRESVLNNKKEIWKSAHQEFELKYHKNSNMRWNDKTWYDQWNGVFTFADLNKESFTRNEVIADIGCGSRPSLEWFNVNDSVEKNYSDPLLSEYVKIPQMKKYWDKELEQGARIFSQPAETPIDSIINRCDFCICWNVLDHCYDGIKVLLNVVSYVKSKGICSIATDFGTTPHIGHPGLNKEAFMEVINKHFDIIKEKNNFRHRQKALLLRKK